MVQNKNRTKSYKVQVSVAVPEENWVIVPNMHEAIIDREKFETVQQLFNARHTDFTRYQSCQHICRVYPLCGLLESNGEKRV